MTMRRAVTEACESRRSSRPKDPSFRLRRGKAALSS